MSKAWAKGSDRRWRRVRAQVLARDGQRCRVKLPGCTAVATQVHHLDGKANGDDPNRLVACCPSCNYQVGDPTRHMPKPTPRTNW